MNPSCTLDSLSQILWGHTVPLQELTPEASARRYFRPQKALSVPGLDARQATVQKWLLVLSPSPPPLATAEILQARGVRVPQLGPACLGAYLVEDLGNHHLNHSPELSHYNSLLETWQGFAFDPLPPQHPNADLALDETLFLRELKFFRTRYLQAFRQSLTTEKQQEAVDLACSEIALAAAHGPQCLQHRDFHSRNILLPTNGEIAWIDHQDLRRGPLFYDLASLYTDAYVDLPDRVYQRLRNETALLGACFGLSHEQSQEHFHLCALQRVLKALGTFGNLLAEGRSDYAEAEKRARGFALSLLDSSQDFRVLREVIA